MQLRQCTRREVAGERWQFPKCSTSEDARNVNIPIVIPHRRRTIQVNAPKLDYIPHVKVIDSNVLYLLHKILVIIIVVSMTSQYEAPLVRFKNIAELVELSTPTGVKIRSLTAATKEINVDLVIMSGKVLAVPAFQKRTNAALA